MCSVVLPTKLFPYLFRIRKAARKFYPDFFAFSLIIPLNFPKVQTHQQETISQVKQDKSGIKRDKLSITLFYLSSYEKIKYLSADIISKTQSALNYNSLIIRIRRRDSYNGLQFCYSSSYDDLDTYPTKEILLLTSKYTNIYVYLAFTRMVNCLYNFEFVGLKKI